MKLNSLIEICKLWPTPSNGGYIFELVTAQYLNRRLLTRTKLTTWEYPMSQESSEAIKSFRELQARNFSLLQDEILANNLDSEAALVMIEQRIAQFDAQIWEIKEKALAATLLKNQIKAKVERAKHDLMPEYNPSNLSSPSAKKPRKIKTSNENKMDATIAMFMKMGLSEQDAKAAISGMVAQTFNIGLNQPTTEVIKQALIECSSCGAYNTPSDKECMVCSNALSIQDKSTGEAESQ